VLLEDLEARQIGSQGEDPELGLVPEHHERQRLMAVGFERRHGVEDPFRGLRVGVSSSAVDRVEQMEHAPPGRRLNGLVHRSPLLVLPNVVDRTLPLEERGDSYAARRWCSSCCLNWSRSTPTRRRKSAKSKVSAAGGGCTLTV